MGLGKFLGENFFRLEENGHLMRHFHWPDVKRQLFYTVPYTHPLFT